MTETFGLGESWDLGYLGAFLAASLASAYVMYGFDTASSLGEESLNPRKNAPRAILRALVASFFLGGAILLFAMMSVTDINDPEIGTPAAASSSSSSTSSAARSATSSCGAS